MEALFCTGCVVLVYQLCLRWFGREVLDNVMTGAQVIVAIGLTVGSQVVPQLIGRLEGRIAIDELQQLWWLGVLPPIWFAAFDASVTGGGTSGSWALAILGVVATAVVLWLAFGKLARDYERGLQGLGESRARPTRARSSRPWLDRLVDHPPLSWWLRDSVARASFLLTARYLVRDRDVMLRVYPGMAPMLVMPFVFMMGPARRNGFGLALTGGFLGLVPMMGLSLMRYSQHWQASDIFRAAPLSGPAPLCHGARCAVLVVLTLPLLALFVTIAWVLSTGWLQMAIFLPGLLLLPVYALVPCLNGEAVPLSMPGEEAKAANRGARMFGITIFSSALAGIGMWALSGGWFWQLLLVEAALVIAAYVLMRRQVAAARWPSLE
jgi:ABC-2 type transport system permease protein